MCVCVCVHVFTSFYRAFYFSSAVIRICAVATALKCYLWYCFIPYTYIIPYTYCTYHARMVMLYHMCRVIPYAYTVCEWLDIATIHRYYMWLYKLTAVWASCVVYWATCISWDVWQEVQEFRETLLYWNWNWLGQCLKAEDWEQSHTLIEQSW